MKINYTSFSLDLGGGARTLLTLASHLAERGHEVSYNILERKVRIDLPVSKKVRIIGGNVPWLLKLFDPLFYAYSGGRWKTDFIRFGWMLEMLGIRMSFDFDRMLYDTIPDCDVSVATSILTGFPVSLSKSRARVFQMQHFDTIFYSKPYDVKRAIASYKLPITIIANSSWLRDKLKKELNVDSIFVPWGIDTKVFNTRRLESDKLSRLFDRSGKQLCVVSLGKSTRWKGLPELFEALRYIKHKRPDLNIKLILYGQEPKLKELSPVECEYVFRPSDKELVYLYQNSDVVVNASYYESFPLPPIEGMACGGKVVTTPYGVEDYAKDGHNAVIVKPKDVRSLAEGIIKVLTDRALGETLVKNAPRVGKDFTWKKSVDRIERIYKKTLDASHEEKTDFNLL